MSDRAHTRASRLRETADAVVRPVPAVVVVLGVVGLIIEVEEGGARP